MLDTALEADFAFPERTENQPRPTVPPHFAHMRMQTDDGVPTGRFRLTGELDEDGEVTQESSPTSLPSTTTTSRRGRSQ